MVRALACHVRSCGFESRLPRTFYKCALPFIIFLTISCSSQADLAYQAKELNLRLLSELNAIHSIEDLQRSKSKFEKIYLQMAELLVKVYEEQSNSFADAEVNIEISEQIQERLYQLYEMDGRLKDLLEECQQEGYLYLRKKLD